MPEYLPIVDISRHQGAVDMTIMRRQGVHGLILRIANGDRIDDRADIYWQAATAAGYDPLWYVFVNPKRVDALGCARACVGYIREITGNTDTALMWDCEGFENEYGTRGPGVISGADYADYMRAARAEVARLAPDMRQFGYTNAAFWDRWVGAHGDDFVRALDWLVPRYPVYSTPGYFRYPLPGVDGWADWAFARASSGPKPPRGVAWAGWQFSAGYNAQGPVYGCQSDDLDLNIVEPDAWARWTNTARPDIPEAITEEDDMAYLINPANPVFQGGLFTPDGHPASPELRDAVLAAGGQIVDQDHAHWDAATLHKMGPEAHQMYDPTYEPPATPKAPTVDQIADEIAGRLSE